MNRFTEKNGFAAELIRVNQLDQLGFEQFVFYPGMLFGSWDKWWGSPGYRHASHEGLDLCFFQAADGSCYRLDAATCIPMAGDSRIVHIMDDFLGQTVVAGRMVPDMDGRELLTIYAHIRPAPGLAAGDPVAHGDVFSRIAPVDAGGPPLLPHLHVSMAWADQLPDYRRWSWKLLNQCGSACFIDPLQTMGMSSRVIPFSFGTDLSSRFKSCRAALAAVPHEIISY